MKNNDLLNTSREFLKEGHYKLVEPMLRELLITEKFNPEVHYMAGTFYLEKGQLKKAVNSFRKSLEIDPHFTDASIGLSIILNDLGRYREGRQVFERAYTLMKQKKSPSHEVNRFSEIRQKNPSFEMSGDLSKKHGELADLYFSCKRYKEALENYNKASAFSKNHLKCKLKVIDCLMKMNLLKQALKEAKNLESQYKKNWNLVSKIIKIRNQTELS